MVEPTHLKNMLVKMGSSSPNFGVKINKYLSCHHLEPFCWPLQGLRSAFSNSSSMTILESNHGDPFVSPPKKRGRSAKGVGKKHQKNAGNREWTQYSMTFFDDFSEWMGFLLGFVESTIDILKLDGIWVEKDVASRFADQSCLGESNLCTFHN